MAAIGSAVGLEQIALHLPYEAARNGGAAFLLADFVAVLIVGLPAMLVEFASDGGHIETSWTRTDAADGFGRLQASSPR